MKKFISLILSLSLLITLFSCENKNTEAKDLSDAGYKIEGSASGISGTPWKDSNCIIKAGNVLADSNDLLVSDIEALPEGTLIAKIDFQDFDTDSQAYKIFEELGFERGSESKGDAANCTAQFSLIDYDNSGDLKLYAKETKGNDSVLHLFSDVQMAAFGEETFTIQYDIICEKESSISLAYGYTGEAYQICDDLAPNSATITKVISNSNENYGSSEIVLIVKGGASGYIDNIIIWKGETENPLDNEPILTGVNKCTAHSYIGEGTCKDPCRCKYCGAVKALPSHDFEEIEGANDAKCKACGAYYSCLLKKDWHIDDIPSYLDDGTVSYLTYKTGQVPDNADFLSENDGQMVIVSNASRDSFGKYIERLKAYGYDAAYANSYGDNVFRMYNSADTSIYLYYINATNEIRIIVDGGIGLTPYDISYEIASKKSGDIVVYQYGLPMLKEDYGSTDADKPTTYINNGMLYVIKLADNSLVIVDGGSKQQFDQAQCDGFMKFLREITGKKEGETIDITAWMFTHAHGDHVGGICVFFSKYGKNFNLKYVMSNFPSQNTNQEIMKDAMGNLTKLSKHLKNDFANTDIQYVKLHTGEVFDFGGFKVSILLTLEDMVNSNCTSCEIGNDFNNTSVVYRYDFDGISFMQLGDASYYEKDCLIKCYSGDNLRYLKADGFQLAHHCINQLDSLYKLIDADYMLVPQGEYSCKGRWRDVFDKAVACTKEKNIRYQDVGTYGFASKNGKFKYVYEHEGIDGGAYDGSWDW